MKRSPQSLSDQMRGKWRRFTRRLSSWNQYLANPPIRIFGFFLTVCFITFLASGYSFTSLENKLSDGVVRADLIAPEDFVVVDTEATNKLRQEAVEQVPPIFEYDSALREHTQNRINSAFEEARTAFIDRLQAQFETTELTVKQKKSKDYQQFLESLTTGQTPFFALSSDPMVVRFLAEREFDQELERDVAQVMTLVLKDFIYPDTNATNARSRRILYQDTVTRTQHEIRGRAVISQSMAQSRLFESLGILRRLNEAEREIIGRMLIPLVQPNLRFSPLLTEEAREKAAQGVPEISTAYRRNQIIARVGDPVTPHIQAVVEQLTRQQHQRNPGRRVLGLFGIVAIILLALYKFTVHARRDLALPPERAFALICVTLVAQTLLIWLGVEMSQRFGFNAGLAGDLSPYEFSVPFAAATLIVALLLDENLALLCTLIVGLLAGLMTGGRIEICIYAILSGCAAAYSVGQYRQRNVIIRAGAFVGLVNILAVTTVISIGDATPTFKIYVMTWLSGLVGGLITAAYASFAVPVSESLFDILTDVKLLELSNADLPLLRELAMRAPGTQQHSVMVSSLASESAEAINANALLVRIGCYYHDIGKLLAPEMFIENQGSGPNPHDTMDPRRSSSVITGHVRKGIIMGREAHLPKEIIDLIPQHHGTRKLHYFYNKALEQSLETGDTVDENDYRYPGPKPQTREAAVVMLADSAEAAARSLDEPTHESIFTIVKKIIDDIIADGQLDECPLTMREIVIIRETLVKTLCNIYHHRVTYPGFNTPGADSEEMGLCSSNTIPVFDPAEVEPSKEPKPVPVRAAAARAVTRPPSKTGEIPPLPAA
ncbi:MAG: HDIG domain-containing protein [Blastocatellia bacterium]|nr:HDIG domain-containing protein [Blastocatellia bacterium]